MKPLSTVLEYHYWSDRMTDQIINNNVTEAPIRTEAGVTLFGLGLKRTEQPAPSTRAAKAVAIESLLSDLVVRDIDYNGPLDYLTRRSQLILSPLMTTSGDYSGAVNMFTELKSQSGKRVGICLFGSVTNVCELDLEVPAWRHYGWTSSTNDGVELLLDAGANGETAKNPESIWKPTGKPTSFSYEVCANALNISVGQGEFHDDTPKPWHRGYTIGHFDNVEWLARIYHSYADIRIPGETFDLVHVGAVLWVRSGGASVWRPYTPDHIPELEADEFPRVVRPAARAWFRRRGRHHRHLP